MSFVSQLALEKMSLHLIGKDVTPPDLLLSLLEA